jgi:hypothetical protein
MNNNMTSLSKPINYKMSSCLLFFDIYFLDCMLMSLLQSVRILSWICHLLIFLFQALSHKPLHQMEPNSYLISNKEFFYISQSESLIGPSSHVEFPKME